MTLAIIEGEAYALGFQGNLPTLGILLAQVRNRSQDPEARDAELAERMARSFGGAPTDEFIRKRLPGVRGRVAGRYLNASRKGFDAVVEALQNLQPDLGPTDDAAEATIAQLLGASPKDQVVRNVVARLRTLRLSGA